MKKIFLFLALNYCLTFYSQVGIGTTTPDAALDITSTSDGLLIPRVALTITTSALPLTTPTNSELVYNSATVADVTPGYYYWDGANWVRLNKDSNSWSILGNTGTSAATNFFGTTDANDLVFKTNNIERFRNFAATGNTSFGSTSDANNARVFIRGNVNSIHSGLTVQQANPSAAGTTTYGSNVRNSSTSTSGTTLGLRAENTSTSTTGASFALEAYNSTSSTSGQSYALNALNSSFGSSTGLTAGAQISNNSSSPGSKFGLRLQLTALATTALRTGLFNEMFVFNNPTNSYAMHNLIRLSATTTSTIYGVYNQGTFLDATCTANGNVVGLFNSFNYLPTSTGIQHGVYNEIFTTSNTRYGTYNNIISNNTATGSGTGQNSYGTFNDLNGNGNQNLYGNYTTITNTGTGTKYGSYNTIATAAGGTHYGVYSEVLKAGATNYAGYFLGRFSIGTTAINNYIMPTSRGTDNQIMITDATGNVTWKSASQANIINDTSGAVIYNITNSEYSVRVLNSVTGVNLPDPTLNTNKVYILIGTNGISAKPLTVTGGTNVFDDVTNANITTIPANSRIMVQSNGTLWYVIGK